METSNNMRALNGSNIMVSPMAWGMWRFAGQSLAGAHALIEAALETGINFFDTADIYGLDGPRFGAAEELLGAVFSQQPELRDQMVLASKGGIMPPVPYDSSSDYLEQVIDDSLRRLRTDRIDLWQVHRPDILTHPADLAATLDKAVASGKVRAVGVSNFTPAQIDALSAYLNAPLASTQPEFSPFHLDPIEDGQLDQAMQHQLTVMAWSPLGGGRISNPDSEREQAIVETLRQVADMHSVSIAAAAYSWIMAHPARPIPIIGSQNVERIRDAGTAYQITWTREDWYKVLVASRGEALP